MTEFKSIQFGVPRTGSTLVWQILNEVMGPTRKVHTFIDTKKPIAISIRDPRDAMISLWRVDNDVTESTTLSWEQVQSVVQRYSHFYRLYDRFDKQYKENVAWIRYERAFTDHDYIYNEFERAFSITIDEQQRELLRSKFSLKANKKISNEFGKFENWDKESKIHGNHVFTGKPETWRQFIEEKHWMYVNQRFAKLLKRWGYSSKT